MRHAREMKSGRLCIASDLPCCLSDFHHLQQWLRWVAGASQRRAARGGPHPTQACAREARVSPFRAARGHSDAHAAHAHLTQSRVSDSRSADTGSGLAGIAKKFCLTGASSMLAEGATFPIDITKTRLQLQGQADFTGTKFGFGGMMANILKTEGVVGLYAGVTPAIARHIPYTGFRAIGYEYIRAFFCGDKPKDQAPLLAKMAAGMSAGAIGQAIAVPCDLIKVRMQSDGRLVAAKKLDKPRYTGLFDAFAKIQAAEGIGGFYAGCWPAIQRAALVNLGELTTYDTAKKAIVPITGDNLLCHLSSAICSGFVASLCSTPADVAKSRIMSQTKLPDGTFPYNGTLDCWKKVVASEGPMALYKGFVPGWLRLGPWQLVFWVSYEQLRILTGIGGFK